MRVGDPSVDLQISSSFLPPAGRDRFIEEYGPVGAESGFRERAFALYLAAMLISYAHHEGNENLEYEARASLARTLVDWD